LTVVAFGLDSTASSALGVHGSTGLAPSATRLPSRKETTRATGQSCQIVSLGHCGGGWGGAVALAAVAFSGAWTAPPSSGGLEKWIKEREPLAPIVPPGIPPIEWRDCNGDGVADRDGIWPDCDDDGVVDWCQIRDNPALDCDGDGNIDTCQLQLDGTDCNSNGVLDACEPQFQLPEFPGNPPIGGWPDDCNVNGVSDRLEICRNPQLDCDSNGRLDSCEIEAGGGAYDCDADGALDTCQIARDPQLDCNLNGVLDRCENLCIAPDILGPIYLGDQDWGRWKIERMPPGCELVNAFALRGPIIVKTVAPPIIEVQAMPLGPGETKPAAIRFVFVCGDCECFTDVPLTVQAYDRIELEARVFIPCQMACAPDPLDGSALRCFAGDCRPFDCGLAPLPTSVTAPSSRVLLGIDFRTSLGWWATPYSGVHPSQEVANWAGRSYTEFAFCNGELVPVGGDLTNCDREALGYLAPCPVPSGYSPPPPTFADTSFGTPDVLFVGSPRYKRIQLTISEVNTCIPYAPAIDARAQIGLWQRCDPAQGMQQARYDFWWKHDFFPAYELVYERTSHDGSFEKGCLSRSTPALGPAAGLLGPLMAVQETPSPCGVPHEMLGGWPVFDWSEVTPLCPWMVLP